MNPDQQILVVDGHNAMHAWPEMAAALRGGKSTLVARSRLIAELQWFHDGSPWQVVVVFDGGEREASDKPATGNGLKVIYASDRRSADGVIERIVVRFAKDCRMIVATNDRLVANAALGAGADVVSIRGLEDMVAASAKDFKARHKGYFRDDDRRP